LPVGEDVTEEHGEKGPAVAKVAADERFVGGEFNRETNKHAVLKGSVGRGAQRIFY